MHKRYSTSQPIPPLPLLPTISHSHALMPCNEHDSTPCRPHTYPDAHADLLPDDLSPPHTRIHTSTHTTRHMQKSPLGAALQRSVAQDLLDGFKWCHERVRGPCVCVGGGAWPWCTWWMCWEWVGDVEGGLHVNGYRQPLDAFSQSNKITDAC
jgi:hypothetical protein